ncbi:MAG: hypothetical protein AAB393_19500, partial [Bacteroidota bacterium]
MKVSREGGETADVECDIGDTVESIAAVIGLDPIDYGQWLTLLRDDPESAPKQKEPFKQKRHFSVPNTIAVYRTRRAQDPQVPVPQWEVHVQYLKDRGFNVVVSDNYDVKEKLGPLAMQRRLVQLVDKKVLHGFLYHGHGRASVLTPGPSLTHMGEEQLNRSVASLKYKLAFVLILGCTGNALEPDLCSGTASSKFYNSEWAMKQLINEHLPPGA